MGALGTITPQEGWMLHIACSLLEPACGGLHALLHCRFAVQAVIVSVYSAASCLGRLTTAFIPEKAFRKLGFARTNFL